MLKFLTLLLCGLATTTRAYNSFFKIYQTVDVNRRWTLIITSKQFEPITTRMKGRLTLHSIGSRGKVFDEFAIPLGGFVLDKNGSSVMTHVPLPHYEEPLLVTCKLEFPDLSFKEDRVFEDSIPYWWSKGEKK